MLTAGTSEIDISPEGPLRGRHDVLIVVKPEKPIHARALALKTDGQLTVVVCCEIMGFDAQFACQLEAKIAKAVDIPAGQVILWTTHTHNCPCASLFTEQFVREEKLGLSNQKWYDQLAEKLPLVAKQATEHMQPVTIAGGIGEIHGIASNRRIKMPDGSFAHRGSGGGNPALRDYPEGNIDPFVRSLFLLGQDGSAIAVLYNYACHPTSLGGGYTYHINPDYPGYAADAIKAQLGQDVGCFFGMGASGNINCGKFTGNARDTKITKGLGNILADEVIRQFQAIKQGCQIKQVQVDWQVHKFPADKELIADVQTAEKGLKDAIEAYRSAKTADQKDLQQVEKSLFDAIWRTRQAICGKDGTIAVDMRKLTFDDQACVLFTAGECFVDIGKEVFKQSVYPMTYFMTMLNASPLYTPNKEVFQDPSGYGVNTMRQISQQGCHELAETLYRKVSS